jgi:SAM-dependent methyltransferase
VIDPTKRFSNRVENYVKYRPSYPAAIVPLLESECGLTPESVIADLGSGTGLLSEIFLRNGNPLIGVEPNLEMRLAGEKHLRQYPKFSSVEGTAEATTLANESVDFITAGQSFHWFDRARARVEFERILKPGGWVAIVWNGFRVETSALNAAYQDLVLEYGTDYEAVHHEVVAADIESFFPAGNCKFARFDFQQRFGYEGLEGRLLSSSYAPEPDHPNYHPMLRDLRTVFNENQKDGKIVFDYETEIYYGQLSVK